MFWFTPAMLEAAAAGQVTASGSVDPAFLAWTAQMRDYQGATNSGGLPKLNFWLVISLPGDNFSEKLEWHEELPMLMPASGTGALLGLAQTKAELDEMMFEDAKTKEGKTGNIHLTYKVKIQGSKAWRDLIDFMAKHDMIEKES